MKLLSQFLENGESIEVGEYTIRELSDGSIWIKREDGEGMQVSLEIFEELIADFYKENF